MQYPAPSYYSTDGYFIINDDDKIKLFKNKKIG
jgi:hypothetical protein